MRRQPASLLAEKPNMLMLKFLAFGWHGVNAVAKLKPFSFLISIDIIASWHGLLRSLTNASAACQLAC